MTLSDNSGKRTKMKSILNEDSITNENRSKRLKNESYTSKEIFNLNKVRIYNFEQRKKPAELVRKDLISAMKMPDHEVLHKGDYLTILDPWREEWEKGVQIPVNPDSLPKPSITLLNKMSSSSGSSSEIDPSLISPVKSTSKGSFKLPKDLIVFEQPTENNVSTYELDLQDICFLNTFKDCAQGVYISDNILEDVINELEQQCARNIKQHQVGIEYDDHIVCDVCQSPDGEDGNEMVFCDLCNICVHQACYGISEIPEGDWLCGSCKDNGSKKSVLCVLCPNVGGALKKTTKNQWAHVSCVYWIPEAKFLNVDTLEPVEIKSIPNWRWNLACSLCNVKKGAPIICDEKNCRVSYHVTCAFKYKLKMKISLFEDKSNCKLKSYCVKHSQNRSELLSDGSTKEIDFIVPSIKSESESDHPRFITNPQHEFWKYIDINKVHQEISKKYIQENDDDEDNGDLSITQESLRKIIDFIHNYWILKRVSNYGNSLIKLSFAQKFKEQLRVQKNQILHLRYHLERLRTLTYMLGRREKIKRSWLSTQREIFEKSCHLFTGINLTSPNNESSTNNNFTKQTPDNVKLFNTIINHHNIYSATTSNEIPTEESQIEFEIQPEIKTHSLTPLKKKISSFISADPVPLTPKNTKLEKPSTSSAITIISPQSFTKNESSEKKSKQSADKSVTNHIIRELKRLTKLKDIQNQRVNPYAKYYLHSGSKRKQDDGDTVNDNASPSVQSTSDESKHSKIVEDNNRVNRSSSIKNDRCKSTNLPTSVSSSKISNSSSINSIASKPKKIEASPNSVHSLFDLNYTPSKQLSSYKIPKKKIDFNSNVDAKITTRVHSTETKNYYNFRKTNYNEPVITSNDNYNQKVTDDNIPFESNSNESPQKENGHYDPPVVSSRASSQKDSRYHHENNSRRMMTNNDNDCDDEITMKVDEENINHDIDMRIGNLNQCSPINGNRLFQCNNHNQVLPHNNNNNNRRTFKNNENYKSADTGSNNNNNNNNSPKNGKYYKFRRYNNNNHHRNHSYNNRYTGNQMSNYYQSNGNNNHHNNNNDNNNNNNKAINRTTNLKATY